MNLKSIFSAAIAFLAAAALNVPAAPAAEAPVVSSIAVTAAGLNTPVRAAVDASGMTVVTDPRAGGLVRLDSSGKPAGVIAVSGAPEGIAVTSAGNLVVSRGDSVVILSPDGRQLGLLGSGIGQFKMANGIAVDAAGNIYVADSIDNTVYVFRPDGAFSFRFGSTGTGTSQFLMPTGVAYEKASGQLAVIDTNNGRIQFFNASGAFQKSIGSVGSGPQKFTTPQAITFEYSSAGSLSRMYVVDSFQGNIQVLDADGNFLSYLGTYGTKPGQLIVPSDAVFDQARQRLLVVNGLGNVTSYTIQGEGPVDTTPPALAVTNYVPVINGTTYTLQGTVEAGAVVSVFVGGSQVGGTARVTGGTWSYDVTGLVTGANAIRITATDAARNVSTQNLSITVNPPNVYSVTAAAGDGGTISASSTVSSGQTKKILITPAAGYHIADVIVDGVSQGPISTYTFSKISGNHTITALFSSTYTVTAAVTAGEGTISPVTPAVVRQGSTIVMTFVPSTGWHVEKVVVDGATKAAATTYTLASVSANHQINVSFAKNTYKITATKTGRGTITPASSVVEHGKPYTVTLVPGVGNHVDSVLIDGVAQSNPTTTVTFPAVDAPHTVKAVFAINTYTVTSAAYPPEGGTITAGGTLRYGTSKTFSLKPKAGYVISDLKVNGVSVGAKKTYRLGPLTNAAAKDYTVEAYFAPTAAVAVSALSDGRTAASRVQNVTGTVTSASSKVTINGQPVPVTGGIYSGTVTLADGANVIRIVETPATGTAVSGSRTILYGEGLPALTVGAPADGARTDTAIVTFSGTVSAGAAVTVGGIPATVNGTTWTASVNLDSGMNTVEVVATDGTGSAAVKRTILVDLVAPAVAVTSPADDIATNLSSVTLQGMVDAGATVAATVNGTALPVSQDGAQFTIVLPLAADGTYSVAVTATDASGRTSTTIRTVVRDTKPPKLTVAAAAGANLSGTVEAGAAVTIRDAAGVIGAAKVAGTAWSFDLTGRTFDAATLRIQAADAAGNVTEVAP